VEKKILTGSQLKHIRTRKIFTLGESAVCTYTSLSRRQSETDVAKTSICLLLKRYNWYRDYTNWLQI